MESSSTRSSVITRVIASVSGLCCDLGGVDVLFPQAVRSDRPARRQVLPDERGRPDRSECPLCPLDVSVPLCCRLSEA